MGKIKQEITGPIVEKRDAYKYPRFVRVKEPGGSICEREYKSIIAHEQAVIEDNVFYGARHEYPSSEIDSYECEARKELKALKKFIRENPDGVLCLDSTTERYVPAICKKTTEGE